ncbi:TfuA-like protein [Pseudomonas sp. 8 R 14]|uniref:TfuA-like protein n=1 Tax=Pseudomonas sp. 8 R 14 TaxID=1844092 RepID=UPI000811F62B|nr:TfuA-like protein [Pseudomonas sp. 8 R 14]CRL98305.1 hypothetical protein [Pseudomonas sp. 8 R 14]
MNDNCYVFLGPSLNKQKASSILDAVYLPPAKQADILSLVRNNKPHSIVLIDGEFGQSLSVWHKEILYALDQGVKVYGASSMGALRAAELEKFGMHGIGKIFEDYRSGAILADDEVALTYLPSELAFSCVTIPMVNIRSTLDRAQSLGLISSRVSTELKKILHSVFFADRDLKVIVEILNNEGLPTALSEKIFTELYIDQKQIDAIAALNYVNDRHANNDTPNKITSFKFERSYTFDVLEYQDCMNHDGVRFRELAKYISLHHKDLETLSMAALNREATLLLATTLMIGVNNNEIEEEVGRFKKKHGIIATASYLHWLIENDINEEEFEKLMKQNAVIRKLQTWQISRQAAKETTKLLLDQCRLMGEYSAWSVRKNNCKNINKDLSKDFPSKSFSDSNKELSEMFLYHVQRRGMPMTTTLEKWMMEACFQGRSDLYHELRKSVGADKALDALALEFASLIRI